MSSRKALSIDEQQDLLNLMETRFNNNLDRHAGLKWADVEKKLRAQPDKMWSLNEMERTGGAPDVVDYNEESDSYTFFDCSPESPDGRRKCCYDHQGLISRKNHKPDHNAVDFAADMGIELLTEDEYNLLQKLGPCDTKTSSWLKTPRSVREKGGALFGDYRYGRVFIYHNGAQSYYAARGFRGKLLV